MFFFGLDRAVFLFLLSREGAGRAFAGLLQVQAWNISLFYSILKKKKQRTCLSSLKFRAVRHFRNLRTPFNITSL